jgi:ParB family transcriptional regulator, chromosome partitioning protein
MDMIMQPKRRLGRGLAALIGDDEPEVPVVVQPQVSSAAVVQGGVQGAVQAPVQQVSTSPGLRTVPIELIRANPNNPRKKFNQEELTQLADSIKSKGLLQPLVVRPLPQGQSGYELVAGERRWRASQIAQLHAVPVVVRELDDRESLEIALIENIQRADLNAVEEAMGYRQLMEQYSYTQQQLADGIGKSRSHITNTMRLLTLPQEIQTKILEGTLTAGHARTLVAVDAPHELAEQIIQLGLSVRQAEELARTSPGGSPRGGVKSEKDADTRQIERELQASLGLGVEIAHKGGRDGKDGGGKVTISYATLDQLDEVIKRLRR